MFSVKHETQAGWWVSEHVVDRFIERVGSFGRTRLEIATWLRANAHLSVPIVGEKLKDGKRCYRLEHPWGKPDAVLVVGIDPDGTRAVVTCGWWEEGDDEVDTVSPAEEEKNKYVVPTPPPLLFPSGQLPLFFVRKGLTLDLEQMMGWELDLWAKYLKKMSVVNSGRPGPWCDAQKAISKERTLRQDAGIAHTIDRDIYLQRISAAMKQGKKIGRESLTKAGK